MKRELDIITESVGRLRESRVTDKQKVIEQINGLLSILKGCEDDKYKINWCIGRLEILKKEL